MDRKHKHDDYWPPRPGSWEEAVDPYEVQGARAGNTRAKEALSTAPSKAHGAMTRSRVNVPVGL